MARSDPHTRQLVVNAQQGDRHALEALVRLLQPLMVQQALVILRDPAEAEDAFLDALEAVLRHLPGFKPPGGFRAYAAQAARNAAVDRYRRRRSRSTWGGFRPERAGRQPSPGVAVGVEALTGTTIDPEQQLIERELGELLTAAVAALRPPLDDYIAMYYEQGMTYDEVAEHMGVSRSTVKRQLGRARLRLARRLTDFQEGEDDVA